MAKQRYYNKGIWKDTDGNVEEGMFIPHSPGININVTTPEQREAYKELLKKMNGKGPDERGEFFQFIHDSGEDEELTAQEKHRLMELLCFCSYDTKPFSFNNGKLLNTKNIGTEVWDLPKQKVTTLLSKFVADGYIERKNCNPGDKRETNFISTGKYFWKGSRVHRSFTTKLFQDKLAQVKTQLKANTPDQKKQTAPLSIIFSVSKHFHFQTYYMSENPNEDIRNDPNESIKDALKRNLKAVKYITRDRLMELAGINDRRTLEKYINMLQDANAILEIKGKRKSKFLIHPDLMFRLDSDGYDDYTESVRLLFDVQEAEEMR